MSFDCSTLLCALTFGLSEVWGALPLISSGHVYQPDRKLFASLKLTCPLNGTHSTTPPWIGTVIFNLCNKEKANQSNITLTSYRCHKNTSNELTHSTDTVMVIFVGVALCFWSDSHFWWSVHSDHQKTAKILHDSHMLLMLVIYY